MIYCDNIKASWVMVSNHSLFEVLAVQLNDPEPFLIVTVNGPLKSVFVSKHHVFYFVFSSELGALLVPHCAIVLIGQIKIYIINHTNILTTDFTPVVTVSVCLSLLIFQPITRPYSGSNLGENSYCHKIYHFSQ